MNKGRNWLVLCAIVVGAWIWLGQPIGQAPSSPAISAADGTVQPRVMLFGTAWCPYCAKTRYFFSANGIQFADLDVEKSTEARRQYKELRGTGVPVIVIGDRVFRGFDEELLRNELGPWLKGHEAPSSAPDIRA